MKKKLCEGDFAPDRPVHPYFFFVLLVDALAAVGLAAGTGPDEGAEGAGVSETPEELEVAALASECGAWAWGPAPVEDDATDVEDALLPLPLPLLLFTEEAKRCCAVGVAEEAVLEPFEKSVAYVSSASFGDASLMHAVTRSLNSRYPTRKSI